MAMIKTKRERAGTMSPNTKAKSFTRLNSAAFLERRMHVGFSTQKKPRNQGFCRARAHRTLCGTAAVQLHSCSILSHNANSSRMTPPSSDCDEESTWVSNLGP